MTAKGSLVLVHYLNNPGRWLGLVVDQKLGEEWAAQDPCVECPADTKEQPVLVRVLGLKLTEGAVLRSSAIPERESRRVETVRWAYVQASPQPPFVVAGPDVESITGFLEQRLESQPFCSPGCGEMTFLDDLKLLVEYLTDGQMRAPDEMSIEELKFFVMLASVLPR